MCNSNLENDALQVQNWIIMPWRQPKIFVVQKVGLLRFYSISTVVGYLKPNPVYTHTHTHTHTHILKISK